jgi:hypothetical protein
MLLVRLQVAVGVFDELTAVDDPHAGTGAHFQALDEQVLRGGRDRAADGRSNPVNAPDGSRTLGHFGEERTDERFKHRAVARLLAPFEQVEKVAAELHHQHLGPQFGEQLLDLGNVITRRAVSAPHPVSVLERNRTRLAGLDAPVTAKRLGFGIGFERGPRKRMRAACHVGVDQRDTPGPELAVEPRTETTEGHRIAENKDRRKPLAGGCERARPGEDRGQSDRAQHLEETTARPERGAAVGERAQEQNGLTQADFTFKLRIKDFTFRGW